MKVQIFNLSVWFTLFLILSSCGDDGIKKIVIGKQVWMAENLNVDKFTNGDPIPEAKTNEEWEKAGSSGEPAWCYYDNNTENGSRYGKLYNWFAVNDPRGLAPKGWKIPTSEDWSILIDTLDSDVAGVKMKSTILWGESVYSSISGNGNNKSGFTGLPGGGRLEDGEFVEIGTYGYWWSFSDRSAGRVWGRYLSSNKNDVGINTDNKGDGLSVRCLRK
jgi:uncharacterized protein (TIGR02145 family)